jgi:hypothetical protein
MSEFTDKLHTLEEVLEEIHGNKCTVVLEYAAAEDDCQHYPASVDVSYRHFTDKGAATVMIGKFYIIDDKREPDKEYKVSIEAVLEDAAKEIGKRRLSMMETDLQRMLDKAHNIQRALGLVGPSYDMYSGGKLFNLWEHHGLGFKGYLKREWET